MEFFELVKTSRTYRRFYENKRISHDDMLSLISLARMTPSTGNKQVLKFIIADSQKDCDIIFPTLHWAGLLKDWDGPEEGERPTGYIIILTDLSLAQDMRIDDGIVAQTIMLGARNIGYGGCILGSIDREIIFEKFNIDKTKYSIDLILALGVPKEKVEIVDVKNNATAYYRDEDQTHFVPKRDISDLILGGKNE